MMEKENKSFFPKRENIIIVMAGCLLVILGFLLMTGPGTVDTHYESDIFNPRRIGIAPVVSLAGFVVIAVGILFFHKTKE